VVLEKGMAGRYLSAGHPVLPPAPKTPFPAIKIATKAQKHKGFIYNNN
jgi:hypothetical protein